ncbi:glycoside hydrolase family 2 TIM barrel-domain containing protein [Pontibacter brevis]
MDVSWRFLRDSVAGAEVPNFNDTQWRTVDLPHDFSIEDLPGPDTEEQIGPFTKQSPGGPSTGHVMGGTGWYRKKFTLLPDDHNKIIRIHFDGVYMESDVWVNGKHLGYHPNGYTPFYYDLTPHLNPAGQENVLAVRVKNNGRNSRWYSGSGIYRHVWLTATAPVHIDTWGVAITTPEVSPDSATIRLNIRLRNESETAKQLAVVTHLVDTGNKVIAEAETSAHTILKGGQSELVQTMQLSSPVLWSLENPHLYKAVVSILENGHVVDQYVQDFGVRSISFSATEGFLLNGRKVLLKGANMHHDNGLLGAAAIGRAEERKVAIMKANGFNAIRTSHNPPSAEFLDACDRLGVLVMDEVFDMWEHPKNPQDYHLYFKEWGKRDMESILLRDRNHPSVIFWSIGNEIYERADSSGVRIAKELAELCHSIDPTRPVTAGISGFWDHPGRTWDETAPAFRYLGVHGYNYSWKEYEADHLKYPDRVMAGTETFPREAFINWQQAKQHSWVIGGFVWTGMDHLGESGIGHAVLNKEAGGLMPWPWYVNWCGDIDLLGNKKPQSYYRDVVWGQSTLEMAVHAPIPAGSVEYISKWGWPDEHQSWTWPGEEGKQLSAAVYANAQKVRLELNGRPIGEKPILPESLLTATFEVPYAPGELKAVAITDGKEIATKVLRTTGLPAGLRLTPDRSQIRASRNDLAYVAVEVIDEAGNIVPFAAVPVRFSVAGNGELAATGNASPHDMKSFRQPVGKTYHGRSMAIVRPSGKNGSITLTATAEGMEPVSVIIQTTGGEYEE